MPQSFYNFLFYILWFKYAACSDFYDRRAKNISEMLTDLQITNNDYFHSLVPLEQLKETLINENNKAKTAVVSKKAGVGKSGLEKLGVAMEKSTAELLDNSSFHPKLLLSSLKLLKYHTISHRDTHIKHDSNTVQEANNTGYLTDSINSLTRKSTTILTNENVKLCSYNPTGYEFTVASSECMCVGSPRSAWNVRELHGNPRQLSCSLLDTNKLCSNENLCWLKGDCCPDYFSHLYNATPDAEDHTLFKLELLKINSYSELNEYLETLQWNIVSTCKPIWPDFKQYFYMVTRCSMDENFQAKFNSLFENLKTSQNYMSALFVGLSKQDVINRCENNTPEAYTMGMDLINYIPFATYGQNFYNIFCAVCNGLDPYFVTSWQIHYALRTNQSDYSIRNLFRLNDFVNILRDSHVALHHKNFQRKCNIDSSTKTGAIKDRTQTLGLSKPRGITHYEKLCSRIASPVAGNGKAYSNIFCYLLESNLNDSVYFEFENKCEVLRVKTPRGFRRCNGVTGKIVNVSSILYDGKESPNLFTRKQCPIGLAYLPHNDSCVLSQCPDNMVFIDNACRDYDACALNTVKQNSLCHFRETNRTDNTIQLLFPNQTKTISISYALRYLYSKYLFQNTNSIEDRKVCLKPGSGREHFFSVWRNLKRNESKVDFYDLANSFFNTFHILMSDSFMFRRIKNISLLIKMESHECPTIATKIRKLFYWDVIHTETEVFVDVSMEVDFIFTCDDIASTRVIFVYNLPVKNPCAKSSGSVNEKYSRHDVCMTFKAEFPTEYDRNSVRSHWLTNNYGITNPKNFRNFGLDLVYISLSNMCTSVDHDRKTHLIKRKVGVRESYQCTSGVARVSKTVKVKVKNSTLFDDEGFWVDGPNLHYWYDLLLLGGSVDNGLLTLSWCDDYRSIDTCSYFDLLRFNSSQYILRENVILVTEELSALSTYVDKMYTSLQKREADNVYDLIESYVYEYRTSVEVYDEEHYVNTKTGVTVCKGLRRTFVTAQSSLTVHSLIFNILNFYICISVV